MPNPWIDVSLPIERDSVAWAGLPSPELRQLARIEDGASVTVGQLDCCLHTGTHADAPAHVLPGAPSIEQLGLDAFLGPAMLIRCQDRASISRAELSSLGVEALRGRPEGRRLLIATPQQYDGRRFPERIPHVEVEAAELLAWLGIQLLGVNVPSIDPLDSRSMLAHKTLFGAGAGLLENLRLDGLEPGGYTLAAAPIRIVGADAAPVRALLRPA